MQAMSWLLTPDRGYQCTKITLQRGQVSAVDRLELAIKR